MCDGVCGGNEQAAGCHIECRRLVPDKTRRLALLAAARYSYEPWRAQDDRRRQWLLARWTDVLHHEYRRRYGVPRELCSQIAQLSLRHFALANALASLNIRSTRPVRISKSIWARYTLFEGIWYIASMSNKAGGGAAHDDDILVVSESEPSTVFVAEDHLGIRGLLEGGVGVTSTVKSHRGIW